MFSLKISWNVRLKVCFFKIIRLAKVFYWQKNGFLTTIVNPLNMIKLYKVKYILYNQRYLYRNVLYLLYNLIKEYIIYNYSECIRKVSFLFFTILSLYNEPQVLFHYRWTETGFVLIRTSSVDTTKNL